MEGFNVWWPLEGSIIWWPLQGSVAWWPLQGSNAWRPMKGEGEAPFPIFQLSPQQFYLNFHFFHWS